MLCRSGVRPSTRQPSFPDGVFALSRRGSSGISGSLHLLQPPEMCFLFHPPSASEKLPYVFSNQTEVLSWQKAELFTEETSAPPLRLEGRSEGTLTFLMLKCRKVFAGAHTGGKVLQNFRKTISDTSRALLAQTHKRIQTRIYRVQQEDEVEEMKMRRSSVEPAHQCQAKDGASRGQTGP